MSCAAPSRSPDLCCSGGGKHGGVGREGGIPWHRGCAATGHCHDTGKTGFGFWKPLGGQEWGGGPGEVTQWVTPCEIPLVPDEMSARSGRRGRIMEGNSGRESLDFRGRQEVAGDKGLGDDWHGGSGGRETSRPAPGRGREQGERERWRKGKREREDGGEGAAVTLQSLRGSADPAAPSPSRGPHDKT